MVTSFSINLLIRLYPDPAKINPCQQMKINAALSSDSGCRPYTYFWTFTTNSTNATANERLQNTIDSVGNTSTLTIPHSQLNINSNYTFTLTIQNSMGVNSPPASINITTTGFQPIQMQLNPSSNLFSHKNIVNIMSRFSYHRKLQRSEYNCNPRRIMLSLYILLELRLEQHKFNSTSNSQHFPN